MGRRDGIARQLGLFGWIWLTVGFTAGTAVLIGPVRWIAAHGRERGWTDDTESWLVRLTIALLIAGSALAAAWLSRHASRSSLRHVRLGVPALTSLFAVAAVGLWLSPGLMGASMGAELRAGSSFTFGPYPASDTQLAALRERGFTTIVSLLHPAVVPFETKLIADGRAAAERSGLEYIHLPMLPWVSDNGASLDRLRRLAADGGGRYYVHCYLGKDRIRIARRVVAESLPAAGTVETTAFTAAHAAARSLDDVDSLERGQVVRLDDGAWLLPFPTDDEFMSYVLPGTHGRVVSLLDPADPGDRPWIDRERELLEGNGMTLAVRPLANDPFDPHAVLDAAREVAAGERPVVVHAFLSAASGRAPSAEGFLQAFRSGQPPLPPSLFDEPLAAGPAEVVAPNVALGPRPSGPEFGAVLHRRGVRSFVYAGGAVDPAAVEDRRICEEAGLDWRVAEDDGALERLVRTGGPWYVYGPRADAVRPELTAAIGPAIPDEMRWDPHAPPPGARLAATFARFVPDVKTIVLLGPFCLLFGALAANGAGWLRASREVRAPFTRKLFHFAIFTAAGVLHLSAGLPAVSLFGAAIAAIVLYAVWRGEGFAFYEALARPSDAPRRTLFILVPLATTAIGGVVSNLLFGAFASIGYLVCGWGDAVGEPVGTAFGRHRYRVPSLGGVAAWRSLEGSAAVYVVGALAAFGGLLLAGYAPLTALGIGIACGLAGTAVEAISNHGLDNLTVQIAAAGTAWFLLG